MDNPEKYICDFTGKPTSIRVRIPTGMSSNGIEHEVDYDVYDVHPDYFKKFVDIVLKCMDYESGNYISKILRANIKNEQRT